MEVSETREPAGLEAERQRELRESEERLLRLFHASANPMMITSLVEDRIVDVNESAARLFERQRERMIGRISSELGLWAVPEQRAAIQRKAMADGVVHAFEMKLTTGAGELLNVLHSATLATVNNEQCLLGIIVDAETRAREAFALRQSEEKHRMLVENSLQGLAIIQDNRFVFCNKAFADMSGYSIDELLSLSQDEIERLIHPEDRAMVRNRYIDRLAGKATPWRYQCRGLKRDGSAYWMEMLVSLVEYNGRPAVQLAYMDITEHKRAEAAAREYAERLDLALEAAGMGSWDLDVETGEVTDDERWLKSLGYAHGEIESNVRAWNALVHPDDLPMIEDAAAAHVEGKTPIYEVEHRLRSKAGDWVWVLNRGKIISRDSSGRPLRTVGVHLDITKQKLARENIKRLANEQKAILNTISLGINYVRNRRIQWANPAFLRMFAYETPELHGLDMPVLFSRQDDYARMIAEGYPKLAIGEGWSFEAPMLTKGGDSLWCSIAGQAIDTRNLEEGSIWVFQDITGRKRGEKALRESEERLRRLLQNSNDIIVIIDRNGVPTYISNPIEKIMGYGPEDLIGTDFFAGVHPEELQEARESFTDLVKRPGATMRLEHRFRHRNGTWMPVETVASNLLDDPAVNGVVLNIRDTSERNRLQEQLQQAMKMEAVGVLAGGVAHDFNNLLSVINGYTELLLEDFDRNDPRNRDLEQIAKAGRRAAALTSQLLAFSRKQILKPELLDLNAIVADMSTMLRRLIGEDVELVTIARSDLGAISADPGQVQQIIMNLAVNAREAMPHGGKLTIETANVDFDEAYVHEHPMVVVGPHVMLAVSDNGVGMNAATQSRIFEPFFSTKEKSKGTGLGLSTVYGIVKQSNGFVWVYSEVGKGTTFKIYLPRAAGQAPGQAAVARSGRAVRGSETILVAEDEESVRALAVRILNEAGYHVLEAPDGVEALRIAHEYPGVIDLVLTDVVMPEMSGKTLVSRLLATRPATKALYISGYTDSAIVHHGLLDSNIAFLQKPFTIESLTLKVREAIES